MMTKVFDRVFRRAVDRRVEEREADARVTAAEATLEGLKDRATKAIASIDDRDRQNHWQQAISDLISRRDT